MGYGIDAIIDYMNSWYLGKDRFKTFMSASYENLHTLACKMVQKIVTFIQIDCSKKVVQTAVDYADFENMKRIERSGKGNLIKKYHGTFGERHKTDDPNSFRVRKGQIGGFVDHLSPEDIEYVNERVKRLNV